MNPIGIVQGRLSPPCGGAIQSFPVRTWREEFGRAREAGLACIEWIYEDGTELENPLRTDEGIDEMFRCANDAGVTVSSVCADYYMRHLLVRPDGEACEDAAEHLVWLIGRAARAGCRYVVLPFVDGSRLPTTAHVDQAVRAVQAVLPAAERTSVELHLETDLEPELVAALVDRIGSPVVRANYDMGNSASLGYRPERELRALGERVGSVHVKDRVRGGGTVPLGEGDADLPAAFAMLSRIGYERPLILQVARETGVDETTLAKRNRMTVERLVTAATSSASSTVGQR